MLLTLTVRVQAPKQLTAEIYVSNVTPNRLGISSIVRRREGRGWDVVSTINQASAGHILLYLTWRTNSSNRCNWQATQIKCDTIVEGNDSGIGCQFEEDNFHLKKCISVVLASAYTVLGTHPTKNNVAQPLQMTNGSWSMVLVEPFGCGLFVFSLSLPAQDEFRILVVDNARALFYRRITLGQPQRRRSE